jgi:Asp-tRNA(Asn)/Glu-tRNA(Gln) amidotransferase C subunit
MKREQFDHLCWLARLELEPGETSEFAAKFDKLLGFVDDIKGFAAEGDDEPLVLGSQLAFRSDTRRQFEWPEGFEHDYSVPQIIDFDEGA